MFEDVDGLVQRLHQAARTDAELADPDRVLPEQTGALVDELVGAQRVIAAAEGRSMVLLAELCTWAEQWQDRNDPDRAAQLGPEDLVAAEIAPALHLAPVTAAIRVRTALEVSTRSPATLELMCRGELDKGRVLAIRDATGDLDEPAAARVEARVLPAAVDQTAGELGRALTKAVIAIDPGAAERRRQRAVRDRSVTRWTRPDGTGAIEAVLSAIDSGEIYDLVDEIARQTKTSHDTRSIDARRADAFVLLVLGREPNLGPEDQPPPTEPPPDPERGPLHPDDADTTAEPDWQHRYQDDEDGDGDDPADADSGDAAGLTDSPADLGLPVEPADLDERFPPDPVEVEPFGPTRSERISELAALALSAMISRRPTRVPWVAINQTTNPDGTIVQVGELQGYGPVTAEYAGHLLATGAARPPDQQSGRAPSDAQAHTHDRPDWLDQQVRARDGTCRFPGCARAAHRVDLDHTIEFPRGLTVRENLGGVCRRHHQIKTHRAWRLHQPTDGSGTMTWTSNLTGHSHTTHPRGTTGQWRGASSHQ